MTTANILFNNNEEQVLNLQLKDTDWKKNESRNKIYLYTAFNKHISISKIGATFEKHDRQ